MRRAAAAAAMGAAALLVAACDGSSPEGTTKGVPVGGRSSSTPVSNQAAATAEAERLLSLAELPPGASPTHARPQLLASPAMGTPSDSEQVDVAAYWQVDKPLLSVYRWLKNRTPKGLTRSGNTKGEGPDGPTVWGIEWSEPDRGYAEQLALDESVSSDGRGGTIIRADGRGIWIDPRPYRDVASGARMRVTVAGGCPNSRVNKIGVTNAGADLDKALLPGALPTGGLICQFGGGNAKPAFGLAGKVALSAADARRVATQADRLRLGHTGGGTVSCPMNDGGVVVVALKYSGRPDVDLWWAATGCESVANGHIQVEGGLNLSRWIARSVGPL